MKKKRSWKTTLGGYMTAAGIGMLQSEDEIMKMIGTILGAVGPILCGTAARDNGVSSEDAGAK